MDCMQHVFKEDQASNGLVRELFQLINALKDIGKNVSDYASPDLVDINEDSGIRVLCDNIETSTLDLVREGRSGSSERLWGIDSQSRVLGLEGVDVHIVAAALVGGRQVLVPGLQGVKWLGLKFRYIPSDTDELARHYGNYIYVKSRHVNRFFDGRFNDEAIREEIRSHVESSLLEAAPSNAFVLLDGPLFSTSAALGMDNDYSRLYYSLIEERVRAMNGKNVIGIVKRISHSKYLAKCLNLDIDDESIARRQADNMGGSSNGGRIAYKVGPITIETTDGKYSKTAWYLVVPMGKFRHVVRAESLNAELLDDKIGVVTSMIDPTGTAVPISIADRLSRRLSSAAMHLIGNLSPLNPTYDGLRELENSIRDIGVIP